MSSRGLHKYPWSELSLIILFSMVWAQDYLRFVAQVFHIIPGVRLLAPSVIPLAFIVCILSSLKITQRQIRLSDLLFVGAYVLVYGCTFVLFPQNVLGLSKYAFTFLVTVLPCFLLGVSVDINERIIKILNWVSIVCVFIFYIYYILRASSSLANEVEEGTDFLTIAYQLLPHIMMVIWRSFQTKSLINIGTSIIGVLGLVSLGNRGSIVCLLLFILLYFLIGKTYRNPIKGRIISASIILVPVLLLDVILEGMRNFTISKGMSTRVFDYFEAGAMVGYEYSSNRDYLAERAIREITRNPLGIGIQGSTSIGIEYTHNILLDIFLEYGFIVGGILLIAIVYLFIKGFRMCKDETSRVFGLLIICGGFVHLLFSHTYLTSWMLFFSFGFFLRVIRKGKNKRYAFTANVA